MAFKCKEIRSGPSYESRSSAFCRLKTRVLIIPLLFFLLFFFLFSTELVNYIPLAGRTCKKESGSHRCFALDGAWAACVIKHCNLRYKNDFGFAGESDRAWPLRDIVLYIVRILSIVPSNFPQGRVHLIVTALFKRVNLSTATNWDLKSDQSHFVSISYNNDIIIMSETL